MFKIILTLVLIITIIVIVVKNFRNKRKNDLLYELLNNSEIDNSTFIEWLNRKNVSRKEVLNKMYLKGQISTETFRKYEE